MNEKESLLKQILDDSNEMIQVSDVDTFSVLYANEPARKFTGDASKSYTGLHCYEYLMGRTEQCPFCPIHDIKEQESFEKEVDNGINIYKVKTKKIKWGEKEAFIEYATDITEVRHSLEIYESQVKNLIASIPNAQGIFHMDITEDSVLSINGCSKEIIKMQGLEHVNDLIRNIASYIPVKDEQDFFVAQFNRDHLIHEHEKGKTELSLETSSYFDDKSIRDIRMTARLITNPKNNHLECIVFGLDISEEKQEHEKQDKLLREQLAIFNALSDAYTNVFLADPELSKIKILKLNGYVTTGLDKENDLSYDYKDICEQYIKERVYQDDQEFMRQKLSLDEVKRNLIQANEYISNYRVIHNGEVHYCQFKFIKLEKVNYIIAGFQNIDQIIENEQKQKQLLLDQQKEREEQLIIFNSLARNFKNVYMVNLNEGTAKVLKFEDEFGDNRLDGVMHVTFPYQGFLNEWIDETVYPDDKEMLKQALSIENLNKVFSKQDEYKGNYRMLVDGKIYNFQFNLSKSNQDGFVIAGFQNIEDIIQEHLEAERKEKEKEEIHRKEVNEQLAIFNNLASRFRNVYLANLNTRTAKVLKIADDYDNSEVVNLKNKVFPFDAVIHHWLTQRVYVDDQERLTHALDVDHLREVFKTQKEYTGNYRSIDNGRLRNYQFYVSEIDHEGNVIIGFQIIDEIIEEHLRQERKEREKEEAYQKELEKSYRNLEEMHNIITSSKMGTWKIRLVENELPTLEADDLMLELLGIRDKSMASSDVYNVWFSRITPDALQSVLDSVEEMKSGMVSENTYLWNHPTLGERYVRCGGTAYEVDGGYVLRGYHYDVDEIVRHQKEQEEYLAKTLEKEKQHSEVISSLSTIYTTIFRADLITHNYEMVSSVSSMKNTIPEKGNFDDVKERIITAFMAEDMREEMREFLDVNTLSQRIGSNNTIATEYRNPENRWFQARFIVNSRDENGEVKEVLYVARDFTEEKAQELKQESALRDALIAAKQANRAKTSFLSNMSHDIRTPMNAIIGFTALAQTHIHNTELVHDYLTKIHTSSTHLLSLINEILDMSRIESGTVKLDENVVHLPDILQELRTMIQGQILAKQQNLYIDTLDVVNEDIITDKLRLNQVLLNIVSNAIKYTGNGGNINIRVCEKPCSIKDYATYVFSVKDTGMGMSKEFVNHIFEMFTRETSSTVSGIQGTGLGMSITKNIVDMMNGTIKVNSELGKGSEFVVTVDFKLVNTEQQYQIQPKYIGARALVVDDDVYTCQSVSKMLRSIEMRAEWSTSGKEAIIRAKEATDLKDEYKAYIIDYLMPDMNGIETVRQIRKVIDPDIPIIILTAYDYSDVEEEAKKAGVTAFISKPIFMSELKKVLSCEKSHSSKEEKPVTFSASGKKILLVEDNELNREIASTILKEAGMIVTEATDGVEAVKLMNQADEDTYDLILMDIQMPRMDGYTATREIRTLENNRKANIPIVAMTANAFEEDKQKSIEAGMNGHIAKPIDIAVMAKTFDEIFK